MRTDIKLYKYNDQKYKDRELNLYITKYYFNDVYLCFFKCMKMINHNLLNKSHPTKQCCCILDLDETFFQNDSFLFNTLDIWKYNTKLYDYYTSLGKSFGPILPFMYILYEYLVHKNIHIIFLSGRNIKYKELTVSNLKFFNVTKFELILNDTNDIDYKQKHVNDINKKYDVILCANDQNEFYHKNMVQFPKLYQVSK